MTEDVYENPTSRRRVLKATAALALGHLAHGAVAQPTSKPLSIVVPFPAGGSVDRVARLFADKLPSHLQRPVIVENRPGGSGRLAVGLAKDMAADGSVALYTIGSIVMQSLIYEGKINFDLVRDFNPVAATVRTPLAIAINPALPVKSIKDLVRHSKASKDRLSVGTSGAGSLAHLSFVRLAEAAGMPWVHVPYKGGPPLNSDLMGGHLEVGIDALAEYIENHKAGRMRILAVVSAERSQLAPDIPTLVEEGYPSLKEESWGGFFYPVKTPTSAVTTLQNAVDAVLQDQDVRRKIAQMGSQTSFLPSVKFGEFVKQEFATWAPIVKRANISAE